MGKTVLRGTVISSDQPLKFYISCKSVQGTFPPRTQYGTRTECGTRLVRALLPPLPDPEKQFYVSNGSFPEHPFCFCKDIV